MSELNPEGISEGANTLDKSAEHKDMAQQLVDMRAETKATAADQEALRLQALTELANESPTADNVAIRVRMNEIAQRRAVQDAETTPDQP